MSPCWHGLLCRQGHRKTWCMHIRDTCASVSNKMGGSQRSTRFPLWSVKCLSDLLFTVQLPFPPSYETSFASFLKQDGKILCRRTACDCQNPSVDLFCCPECDTRVTSQCLDQNGQKLYRSGDNWTHSCQQCRCLVCGLSLEGVTPLHWRVTNSFVCGL